MNESAGRIEALRMWSLVCREMPQVRNATTFSTSNRLLLLGGEEYLLPIGTGQSGAELIEALNHQRRSEWVRFYLGAEGEVCWSYLNEKPELVKGKLDLPARGAAPRGSLGNTPRDAWDALAAQAQEEPLRSRDGPRPSRLDCVRNVPRRLDAHPLGLAAVIEYEPRRFKGDRMEHQEAGVRFLLGYERRALFDEMGVCKSKQVIDAATCLFEARLLDAVVVICPWSIRSVWDDPEEGEIAKWSLEPRRVWRFDAQAKPQAKPPEWIITDYEFLRNELRLKQLLETAARALHARAR